MISLSILRHFEAGSDERAAFIKQRRAMVIKLADRSPITALAWSPDGWRIAAGNEGGAAFVIDLRR